MRHSEAIDHGFRRPRRRRNRCNGACSTRHHPRLPNSNCAIGGSQSGPCNWTNKWRILRYNPRHADYPLQGLVHRHRRTVACRPGASRILYEAVAFAIAAFRGDSFVPPLGPGTEFVVTVEKPSVQHRIRLAQVQQWCEATTREGPAGLVKRQKVKELLGR